MYGGSQSGRRGIPEAVGATILPAGGLAGGEGMIGAVAVVFAGARGTMFQDDSGLGRERGVSPNSRLHTGVTVIVVLTVVGVVARLIVELEVAS